MSCTVAPEATEAHQEQPQESLPVELPDSLSRLVTVPQRPWAADPHRLTQAARRQRRAVLVADLAVLARSLPDLVAVLAEVEASGATVLLADEGDTARSLTAADLEAARRAYIQAAIMEGRAKARARGVQFGRPATPAAKAQAVRDAFARGLGVRAAARVGGVGVATASRIRDGALQTDVWSGAALKISLATASRPPTFL
jgi:hypothetical protein